VKKILDILQNHAKIPGSPREFFSPLLNLKNKFFWHGDCLRAKAVPTLNNQPFKKIKKINKKYLDLFRVLM
jgi:hypothetical protein